MAWGDLWSPRRARLDFEHVGPSNAQKRLKTIVRFSHNIYIMGHLFSRPWVCRDCIAGVELFRPRRGPRDSVVEGILYLPPQCGPLRLAGDRFLKPDSSYTTIYIYIYIYIVWLQKLTYDIGAEILLPTCILRSSPLRARTDKSGRLICTKFSALSHGQGPSAVGAT
jgi:hypothetical protein